MATGTVFAQKSADTGLYRSGSMSTTHLIPLTASLAPYEQWDYNAQGCPINACDLQNLASIHRNDFLGVIDWMYFYECI
jgi:hypothetical protein